jgi:REP element-mobilizing transposase RayT
MRHTFIWLYVHVVFSTKNRRGLISNGIRDPLWAYMGGIARKNGVHALKIGGMPDRVHLLLALASMVSIGEAVREIKAGSSLWVHENHNRLFSSQEGFEAFSVSASHLPSVMRYIENQEQHHRKMTFAEEWRQFVEKHLDDCCSASRPIVGLKPDSVPYHVLPGVSLRASFKRAAKNAALDRNRVPRFVRHD